MHVIFVEPAFPVNQREFVGALRAVGATVTAVGEASQDSLDPQLKGWLEHYIQVPSVVDEAAMLKAVRWIQDRRWVDRLEATVEAHILPVAHVREACEIPGTSARSAYLCRDKPAMKEVLREGGIACAASLGSGDREEILAFAAQEGFPLIIKPRAGAGASGTYRVDDEDRLNQVLDEMGVGHGGNVAVEEFVEGHEGFYDTITGGGEIIQDFVTHYFPNVLEAMRHRWISPQFIATNRVDQAEDYREVRKMGKRVLELLELHTTATHMEWFFGPKGLKFSEIGCRPPGVRAWELYNAGNDLDLYHEWAMAIVHGHASRPASRRFSAGMIALRPTQDGQIAGYEGLDLIQSEYKEFVIDYHLPGEGTPTQPVDAGYMANAWVRLRHPDFDQLREMLDRVGKTVKVVAR